MILHLLSFVKFNLVVFQDILIYFVIESHLCKWKEGWVEYIRVGDLYPMMELWERFMMVKESMSTQPANPSIASLCHCLISVCHLALLRCSVNVFFGMFQLTATFTNEILTKGEIKRFSPLRSEFRNLSFLITADDISGVEEQKGDCICWQEEKKECTQGTIYLQFFLNTGDRKCLS